MQLKQLEYLIKIVECGSITQAAQQLFISQPSLSKSVARLEQEYGIKILVRKARGIELTTEGKDLVHYARGVLTAANALERTFSNKQKCQKSRLFLGTQQLDFVYDLFLKTYLMNQDKEIHYNLVETDRSEVIRLVLNGDVDLGILVRSSSDAKTFLWHTEAKQLDIQTVDRSGIHACVGPKSPFYHRDSINFSEAQTCLHVVLDMEAEVKRDLYFGSMQNHFNLNKLIFFNTVSACESFLLKTDALLFVSKWTMGCFKSSKIHTFQVMPDRANDQPPVNELLWLKRAGEPLNLTELQFLHHLYHYFDKPYPEFADSKTRPCVKK